MTVLKYLMQRGHTWTSVCLQLKLTTEQLQDRIKNEFRY